MINYTKVTKNKEVIRLLKEIVNLEKRIRKIDKMALINFELERIK